MKKHEIIARLLKIQAIFFYNTCLASLSFYETLLIYLKENYIGKEINPETIIFYVDSCVKKKNIVGKVFV